MFAVYDIEECNSTVIQLRGNSDDDGQEREGAGVLCSG